MTREWGPLFRAQAEENHGFAPGVLFFLLYCCPRPRRTLGSEGRRQKQNTSIYLLQGKFSLTHFSSSRPQPEIISQCAQPVSTLVRGHSIFFLHFFFFDLLTLRRTNLGSDYNFVMIENRTKLSVACTRALDHCRVLCGGSYLILPTTRYNTPPLHSITATSKCGYMGEKMYVW